MVAHERRLRQSRRPGVRDALEDLASPLDGYGWASTGVYVFFDPLTGAILYVGLARDLAVRFGQHHGLVGCPAEGCKRKQIRKWFARPAYLGYAAFVQSPMNQSDTARWRASLDTLPRNLYDEETPEFRDLPTEGLGHAVLLEGILIEAHRRRHGAWPPWNRIGGSQKGQELATPDAGNLFDLLTGAADSLLVARHTLRELSAEAVTTEYESILHAARLQAMMRTYGRGISTETIVTASRDMATAPHFPPDLREEASRVMHSGYLEREPPPPAIPGSTPGTYRRSSHQAPFD